MDYRSIVSIEIKKEDRAYTFLMPQGASIGEAYDVAHQLLESILKMAKDASEKAKPKDITGDENHG